MRSKLALIVVAASLGLAAVAQAQVHVRGYTRSDGTYVAPHMRSAPDSTINNNYSTYPNTNPYTGQMGTRAPDPYQPLYTPPPAQSSLPCLGYGCN